MKVTCLCILILLISLEAFSQSHPKTVELVDTVSAEICKCMDNALLDIDVDVKELVMSAITDPEHAQGRIQDYLLQVGNERAAEIALQMQKLGSVDSDLTICFNNSTRRFQDLQDEIEGLSEEEQALVLQDFETEEKTIALLMKGVSAREGCEFTYQFIKLGLDLEKK